MRHIRAASISGYRVNPESNARKMQAAPQAERFTVVVDGEAYGPFAYVQIAPCFPPGGNEVRAAHRESPRQRWPLCSSLAGP